MVDGGHGERRHGLSTEQFPVSAYVGSWKNLEDLTGGTQAQVQVQVQAQAQAPAHAYAQDQTQDQAQAQAQKKEKDEEEEEGERVVMGVGFIGGWNGWDGGGAGWEEGVKRRRDGGADPDNSSQ